MNDSTDTPIVTEMHTLADNCMLAVCGRKRPSTTRRADRSTEERLRLQEGDDSITINRHLFKQGPVRDLNRLLDRAYAEHKAMTAPWVDRGPRLLPAAQFEIYAEIMENFKEQITEAVDAITPEWDRLVDDDIAYRSINKTPQQLATIDRDDYPTSEQAEDLFSIEWKMRPINKGSDFRTQVPDFVKEKLNDELNEAKDIIRRDLLMGMLAPVTAAVDKLSIPIGETGSVFRDSLIENLQAQLHRARTLNVTGDQGVADAIDKMNLVVNGYVGSADGMREMAAKRKEAVAQLDDLKNTFTNLL